MEAVRSPRLAAMKVDSRLLASGFQVHGSKIQMIRQFSDIPKTRIQGIDGWIARPLPGLSLGIYTADCAPLFLVADNGALMGALHVGWRGLLAGIVQEALRLMTRDFGLAPKEIEAILGSHIGSCCYEVGAEVGGRFSKECMKEREGKNFLDLSDGIGMVLRRWGVQKISKSPWCTKCSDESLFFSYRRGDKGCQMSLAVSLA